MPELRDWYDTPFTTTLFLMQTRRVRQTFSKPSMSFMGWEAVAVVF